MCKAPRVSVLIPSYNYAHFIEDAIHTVLDQTFQDFELIIVDNQSTDDTEQIIQKYLTDERVLYFKNPVNIGLVGNFNKCMEYARGEYIKFLMADDRFHPTLLEKCVGVLDKFPSVSLITSYRETFGLKSKTLKPLLEGLQPGKRVIEQSIINGRGNWIGEPTTVMFRKSAANSIWFDASFYCLTDLDMWLKLLCKGDCFIIPETLSYFRLHEMQASNSRDVKNKFDEYFFYKRITTNNNYGVDIESVDLNGTIKAKATGCVKAVFKILPFSYKKEKLDLVVHGFKIGYTEGVLIRAIMQLFKIKDQVK
ncbi:MAG TPA: glycosyltransferase family 2 protein [Chitinophagaceae bacterium]|nr:glycosyltransferase family 2 protein [Chitinophagaceae bacterium]